MNAFKFSKKIKVSFSYDNLNTMFQVCVADNGTGVESKNVDAIFKPFNSVRRKHFLNLPSAKTNLNLPISRILCKEMGGDLTLEMR